MITMNPTTGTKQTSCHHPLRPVSWSLRVAAAIDGSSIPSENRPLSMLLIIDAAADTRTMKRANHQYSERLAFPVKSAYLERQIWIDS